MTDTDDRLSTVNVVPTHDDTLLFLHDYVSYEMIVERAEPLREALARHWPGEVAMANVHALDLSLTAGGLTLRLANRQVEPALIHARLFLPGYGHTVTAALSAAGFQVVNDPAAVRVAKSKFAAATALAQASVPIPDQVLLPTPYPGDPYRSTWDLGWPQVLKNDFGNRGRGVHLVTCEESRIEVMTSHRAPGWVVQRFVPESRGHDLRIVVAGGRVVTAVERTSPNGDFRANLSLGGVASPATLTCEEEAVALAATRAVGLTVAGVDVLRSDTGPQVLEVNADPSYLEVSQVTGIDTADHAAAAIVTAARRSEEMATTSRRQSGSSREPAARV